MIVCVMGALWGKAGLSENRTYLIYYQSTKRVILSTLGGGGRAGGGTLG